MFGTVAYLENAVHGELSFRTKTRKARGSAELTEYGRGRVEGGGGGEVGAEGGQGLWTARSS